MADLRTVGLPLTPSDLAALQAAGVSERTAVERARWRRVSHHEAREQCGIRYKSEHLEGQSIPFFHPVDGHLRTYQVRRDNPEVESDGTPIAKYVSSSDRPCLYFGPDCAALLPDTSTTVIIVEAPKSVLAVFDAAAAAQRPRMLEIGTRGCWSWRGTIGKRTSANGARIDEKGILPDFDLVAWKNRDTIICFDANAATNLKVEAARRALAIQLAKRGAKVRIAEVPVEPGTNGPDDYLGRHGAEAFFVHVVDRAKEFASIVRTPVVTYLSSVSAEPVDWIWPGRLARRKYTLVSGEPGLGKTWLLTDVSARISTGGYFPDGTRAPHGRVLWLTAEDGIADTLRPRLDALGADPTNIAVLEAIREPDGSESALSLANDLSVLADAIRQVQPVLVVIDPLTAYFGKVDTHRDSEVRATLAPLISVIEHARCALVAIGHLSKDAQRAALHRPGGSIAFVAAARFVLALASDPNNPDRRVLATLKANLCRHAPALAYRIGDGGLQWEPEPVSDVDLETLFRAVAPNEREDRTDAELVISTLLEDVQIWPLDAKDAIAAGHAHGVHERTLQRTARRLGIRIVRAGFGKGGRWTWHRPTIDDTDGDVASSAPGVSSMSPMPVHEGNQGNNSIDAIDDKKSAFPRAREGDPPTGVIRV